MAVLNVVGYHDPEMETYVCYCCEFNLIGTGSDRGQAINELERTVNESIISSQQGHSAFNNISLPKRTDIQGMIKSIVTEGLKPVEKHKTSTGHMFHVYHFSFSSCDRVKKRDAVKLILEHIEIEKARAEIETTRSRRPFYEEDIPF